VEGGDLPPGADVSLEFERVNDLSDSDGAVRASFEAEIEGLSLRGATLALPDGTVRPFALATPEPGEPGPLFVIREEGTEALILERFPGGRYTIDLTLDTGERRTLAVLVTGSFPDFPEVVEPADGAVGVPLDAFFFWSGPDARYDVVVLNEATGERFEVADAIEDLSARVPAPLEPSTAYRLEIGAEAGTADGVVEFESTRVTRFVTGSR